MATLKDIAKLANVSVSTVSKALNNRSDLNTDTAVAIRRIADELGYAYRVAPSQTRRENVIGVVLPEVISPHYMSIYNALRLQVEQAGYRTVLVISNFDEQTLLGGVDYLCRMGVKGIAFLMDFEQDIQIRRRIERHPDVVFIAITDRLESDCCDCISIDSRSGVHQAVDYLIGTGHKRIAYIGDCLSRTRIVFFKEALEKNGIRPQSEYMIQSSLRFEQCGYEAMGELLRSGTPRPDAVFASYDNVAIGVMRAIEQAGLSVPGDISVIGVDDINTSAYLHKTLSTVAEPTMDMGNIAADILLGKIEGRKTAKQIIKLRTTLIIRESTAQRTGQTL